MEETENTVSDFARLNVVQRCLLSECLPAQTFEMQLSTRMQQELICDGSTSVTTVTGSGLPLHITVEVVQAQAE